MQADLDSVLAVLDELNSRYPRPGIPQLTLSKPYVLAEHYPQKYWPGQGHGRTTGGVYLFFDQEGGLLYVGKASNLALRLSGYFTQGEGGKAQPTSDKSEGIASVRVISLPEGHEFEAGAIEAYLIQRLNPTRNSRVG